MNISIKKILLTLLFPFVLFATNVNGITSPTKINGIEY